MDAGGEDAELVRVRFSSGWVQMGMQEGEAAELLCRELGATRLAVTVGRTSHQRPAPADQLMSTAVAATAAEEQQLVCGLGKAGLTSEPNCLTASVCQLLTPQWWQAGCRQA